MRGAIQNKGVLLIPRKNPTVGGLNEIQFYRTDNFSKVATIPVGKLPHGVWPSGDGAVYVASKMRIAWPRSTR